MLCGAGFGLFQTPNNSTIISSAPTKRSGGASGMLGMARLLGQTFGTTLVALLFSFCRARPEYGGLPHGRKWVCCCGGDCQQSAVVATVYAEKRNESVMTNKTICHRERKS